MSQGPQPLPVPLDGATCTQYVWSTELSGLQYRRYRPATARPGRDRTRHDRGPSPGAVARGGTVLGLTVCGPARCCLVTQPACRAAKLTASAVRRGPRAATGRAAVTRARRRTARRPRRWRFDAVFGIARVPRRVPYEEPAKYSLRSYYSVLRAAIIRLSSGRTVYRSASGVLPIKGEVRKKS